MMVLTTLPRMSDVLHTRIHISHKSFTIRFAHISTQDLICFFFRRLSARDKNKKSVSSPPESRDVGEIDSYFQQI